MTKPDYDACVFSAHWPIQANGGKNYFVFQILDDSGHQTDVLYCDLALSGVEKTMALVTTALIEGRKAKVYLSDVTNKIVECVEIGEPGCGKARTGMIGLTSPTSL